MDDIAKKLIAEERVEAIKGFDMNFRCRSYQFAIGETYKHEGRVEVCKGGFHAIEGHPLEVFSYYPPAGSRFAIVEQWGDLGRHSGDSKLVSASISIKMEISLSDLIERAVKWVFDRAKWVDGPVATGANEAATASGLQGAATASGLQGAATASGYQGAATASGTRGAATASGYQGAATASGLQGAATASGDQGAATASGYQGAATASGLQGAATASGDQGAATASGTRGAATASGDQGAATASGEGCVAMSIGFYARARGSLGSAICLVHRDENTGAIVAIRATKIGENGTEAGVFYTLSADGEFVQVED